MGEMVGIMSSFGTCDIQTPHGGPPFSGWRKGFGFGHAKGPGNYLNDPSQPRELRFTPSGDRALACSAFWRRKNELGPATSFGVGDRPNYSNPEASWVGPDSYGDVSECLRKCKRNVTRKISLKPRFPTMEEKYRDHSWPQCGPGPGKYDTRIPTGQSSWTNPSPSQSWTMPPRIMLQSDLREQMGKPAPGEYDTRVPAGKNSPLVHGTLYDITIAGRLKRHEAGEASPGPAKYVIKGQMDEHGFAQKIANVKVTRRRDPAEKSGSSFRELETLYEEMNERRESKHGLTRVESSPL